MEVIVVNHGSRRSAFNELMERWATEVSKRLGVRAVVGYNEYAEPNWRQLLREAEGDVVIALAFLGEGNHVARDILGELGVDFEQWATSPTYGKRVYVTRPLGDSPLVLSAFLSRIIRAIEAGGGARQSSDVVWNPEEVEESSMRYVAERLGLDLSNWRDRLVARAVYANGNLELAKNVWISPDLLKAAEEAVRAEVPAVVDVRMVAAGLRYRRVHVAVEAPVEGTGVTRSAQGVRHWLKELKHGILVVGNAPTALKAGLDAWRSGEAELAFAVASPVGFTNAERVKEELVESGIPAAVVRGTYGGSGIAAALFNELVKLAHGR